MRDPRPGIDAAFFDQADDAAKLVGQGVARSEHGHLTAME
jgi:hypothetical protein